MFYKKKLDAAECKIAQLKNELSKEKEKREELESFLSWLEKYADSHHYQFCGLRKIKSNDFYIGFLLKTESKCWPDKSYSYTLYGYISGYTSYDLKNQPEDYIAHFRHLYDPRPFGITNELEVTDHCVKKEGLRRNGIGTEGISLLKDIAREFHCTKISGKRVAVEGSGITEEELYSFYEKQGFEQPEGTKKITYITESYNATNDLKTTDAIERLEKIGALKIGYMIYNKLLRLGYTGAEAGEITGMSEKDLQEAEHIIGETIGNEAISDIAE